MFKRPGHGTGFTTTTPRAVGMITLLGPHLRQGGIFLTRDEYHAAARLYGYEPVGPTPRPPEPERPSVPDTYANDAVWRKYKDDLKAWQIWEDPINFMQAGADRNLARFVEADGFRLAAWLARFVEPGQDPLQVLVQMAAQCGWEVPPEDLAWAEGAEQEEEQGEAEAV